MNIKKSKYERKSKIIRSARITIWSLKRWKIQSVMWLVLTAHYSESGKKEMLQPVIRGLKNSLISLCCIRSWRFITVRKSLETDKYRLPFLSASGRQRNTEKELLVDRDKLETDAFFMQDLSHRPLASERDTQCGVAHHHHVLLAAQWRQDHWP